VNLRSQLLLVSLLLLSLPWAGCQFIREMESALRYGQEQSLQATARAAAAVLAEQPNLLYPYQARRGDQAPQRGSIYASPSAQPLILDGYADGWDDIEPVRLSSSQLDAPFAVSHRAVTRKGFLYLLLEIEDPRVIYQNPGLPEQLNGDRLVMRTWLDGERQEYVIATAAPGSVRARFHRRTYRDLDPARIRGYWQDAREGYSLELEIPLAYTGGRLGFYLVNTAVGRPSRTLGTIKPQDRQAPPWLIFSPEELRDAIAPFSFPGSRVEVVDLSQWLLADISSAAESGPDDRDTFWLLRIIYRSILEEQGLEEPPLPVTRGKAQGPEINAALTGLNANHRYRDPHYSTRTRLAAAAPIADEAGVMGAVVVRQSGEQYLSLTDQAFSRLLGYSMLAIGVAALGLLAYASLLSWRIRKLSQAAANAIGEDGALVNTFPASGARDEIGELSRSYAGLLDQLREYNDYLRTLSRKLAHELRTPLAVIQSSLDNLEHENSEPQAAVFLGRARAGLLRLNKILTAMSEANRLEESIRQNQPRPLDLSALLAEVIEAYREIYPEHSLGMQLPDGPAPVEGVPELIVQALDKLLDNAASFCPPGQKILLGLKETGDSWEVSVCNEGPPLPQELKDHLFDPMVSLRDSESEGVHLGLGLHIVRLIAEFHGGGVRADNIPGQGGVIFTLALPATSIRQE
jgi:dedicated sortase system histidine kinase